MGTLRLVNLGVRFLLELGALGAVGYWGWTLRGPMPLRAAAALGAPVALAVLWGIFISPRGRVPTGPAGQAGLGWVVFVVAATALAARGHTRLAVIGALVATLSSVLLYTLHE